jgi:hypothetical protein
LDKTLFKNPHAFLFRLPGLIVSSLNFLQVYFERFFKARLPGQATRFALLLNVISTICLWWGGTAAGVSSGDSCLRFVRNRFILLSGRKTFPPLLTFFGQFSENQIAKSCGKPDGSAPIEVRSRWLHKIRV